MLINDYEIFDQYNLIVFDYPTRESIDYVYWKQIVYNFQELMFDRIASWYYSVKFDCRKKHYVH